VPNETSLADADLSQRILANELANSIEAGQFFLVDQRRIDLQTSAFAGVRALIHGRHLKRGIVDPEVFIFELEASGQIVRVGRWALNTACGGRGPDCPY
jgi:EAL domain-containing protein (putative c-di-GMP-specific phosphodiesterase class I)